MLSRAHLRCRLSDPREGCETRLTSSLSNVPGGGTPCPSPSRFRGSQRGLAEGAPRPSSKTMSDSEPTTTSPATRRSGARVVASRSFARVGGRVAPQPERVVGRASRAQSSSTTLPAPSTATKRNSPSLREAPSGLRTATGASLAPPVSPRATPPAVRYPNACSRRWRSGAVWTVPPAGFRCCGRNAGPRARRNRDVAAVAMGHGQAERARRQRS